MKMTNNKYRAANYIFSFSLLILFTLIMIILIFSGADSYKKVRNNTDMMFNGRTALNYVVNKVHGNDVSGLTVGEKDGCSYLSVTYPNAYYNIYIYAYRGHLYEYMLPKEATFELGNGEKICELTDFKVSFKKDKLLSIEVDDGNEAYSSLVYVNSEDSISNY